MTNFNLFKVDSNVPNFDNKSCNKCGKEIPALYILTKKGKRRDRTNRVDCESPRGYQVTYHKECWWKEVSL